MKNIDEINIYKAYFQSVCPKITEIRNLWFFGSILKETFNKSSDLDVAVDIDHDVYETSKEDFETIRFEKYRKLKLALLNDFTKNFEIKLDIQLYDPAFPIAEVYINSRKLLIYSKHPRN